VKGRRGAVAVDLGATSGRFAIGQVEDGAIRFEIGEQTPHQVRTERGRVVWDLDTLLSIARHGLEAAQAGFDRASIGIDTWGVDHAFVSHQGELLGPPVAYRDPTHQIAFDSISDHQPRLYELTGIQRQPFNTLCQLIARRTEDPTLPDRSRFVMMPDLIARLLGAELGSEITQASTTQLLGIDGCWSAEAFAIAGWPVPEVQPVLPGTQIGSSGGVDIVRVGGHDTASAVVGFGTLTDRDLFLNVGTWSVMGCMLDAPLTSPEGEAANFTNERAADGRVRYLKNIPGFYVVNRIHEELGITETVGDWLERASDPGVRADLHDPLLFNPSSMAEACATLAGKVPDGPEAWAGLALFSLVDALGAVPEELNQVTGRSFDRIRVAGGGSRSLAFCQAEVWRSAKPSPTAPVCPWSPAPWKAPSSATWPCSSWRKASTRMWRRWRPPSTEASRRTRPCRGLASDRSADADLSVRRLLRGGRHRHGRSASTDRLPSRVSCRTDVLRPATVQRRRLGGEPRGR